MKKLLIASLLGMGFLIPSVHANAGSSPANIPQGELLNAKWQVWEDRYDETLYYRVKDKSSRQGIWIKEVDKDDKDTTFKHYSTNCSSGSTVMKDAEIEVKLGGYLDREMEHDVVDSAFKAGALRSLICGSK